MSFTILSLLGALIMLVFGLLDYAMLNAVLYPAMRNRHEKAKLTASQGMDPGVVMGVLKFTSLVLFPVAGLLFGETVLRPFF